MCRRNPHVRVQLCPGLLGSARWPSAPDKRQSRPLFTGGHDFWRQRHYQFGTARLARHGRTVSAADFLHRNGGTFPAREMPDPGSARDPCIGEARMFGFNFARSGWASCDGRLLPITPSMKNRVRIPIRPCLHLVGATFGGDGKPNFSVPDFRGAAAPFKPLTFCFLHRS